jgi:dihydrofolate reductase
MPERHFPSLGGRGGTGDASSSQSSQEAEMTITINQPAGRTLVGNISLSLDGRVAGPGGEYDMSWIVPHAVTDGAREHMLKVTTPATTALLGRKNYQGFSSFWPSVADIEADPRDREFAQWLNAVDKVVFSRSLRDTDWKTHNSPPLALQPPSANSRVRLAGTSSFWPAPASSGTCWRPEKSTA